MTTIYLIFKEVYFMLRTLLELTELNEAQFCEAWKLQNLERGLIWKIT